MKDGFLKVACATPRVRVADVDFNTEQICAQIEEAVGKGAKIIVFPELCITGYTCGDLFYQEELLSASRSALRRLTSFTEKQGADALVFVGLPLEVEGKLYNCAAALQSGRILAFIPKQHLPNYAEFNEVRYFARGEEEVIPLLFEGEEIPFGAGLLLCAQAEPGGSVPPAVVGCEICEDVWVAEAPNIALAASGANIMVNLSASNEVIGKETYRRELITNTSARLIAGYLYATAGEGESTQDAVFSGHNMIADNGHLLAESRLFQNGIIYGEIDVNSLNLSRRRNTTCVTSPLSPYMRIPFCLKEEEPALTREYGKHPFVPEKEGDLEKRCEEILLMQSQGLKSRIAHIHTQRAVLGLSGGLDSTLALLVAVRAFDLLGLSRDGILAVTMPCFGTTDRTYQNACKMAKALGVTLKEVNIKEAVSLHFRDIGQDPEKQDVTFENAQARERTQVLMDLANQCDGLVVGTGDLSELALGWATYNGDHMSMYGSNAGVPKTVIQEVIRWFAEEKISKSEFIQDSKVLKKALLNILSTPISPELLPPDSQGNMNQKTEDKVGPYALHDFFIYHTIRNGATPRKVLFLAKIAFDGIFDEDTIRKWLKIFYKRFFGQQFKRTCSPDSTAVGSVDLSNANWTMASDTFGDEWIDEME